MKCPLRSATTYYPEEKVGIDTFGCLKAECAWWQETTQSCAVERIAQLMSGINNGLADYLRTVYQRQQPPGE